MDYKVVDAVRFGVGTVEGKKSSPWRVWGNKKGDVYASARSMGETFKISLHGDGKCFAGFTSKYKLNHPNFLLNRSRHTDKWELKANTPEIAIQVLFPESELRMYKPKNTEKVNWFAPPLKNQMFVTTIYILPHSIKKVSFDLAKKMLPIASFETNIRNAIIVGHYQELDFETSAWIEQQKENFDQSNFPKSEGYRAIVGGNLINNHRRFILDMAWQKEDKSAS